MKKIITEFLKEKKKQYINKNYIHVRWLEFKEKESWKIVDIDDLDDDFSDFIMDIVGNL